MSTGNKQQLQKYAQPLSVTTTKSDQNQPFSFQDWYNIHLGVIPDQEFSQYNKYLVDWFKSKSEEITDQNLQIKLNYLALLRQLQLFFTKEEAENWYNNVDVNNEKELLLAIPYFAKKLRDISLYYLRLRNAIKESRFNYNQTGTNTGIIDQLQKFILANYTQKPKTSISIPTSIWKDVPQLSAVKDSITIEIEELYDFQSYFDQSPTLPVSAYYNTNDSALQKFLLTKNLSLTSVDWLYKIGAYPLSATYTSASGDNITQLYQSLAEKYLGQDKFLSLGVTVSTQIGIYNNPLATGNNFFYWPSGIHKEKALTLPRYQSQALSAIENTTLTTAGTSIEFADTIFVKTVQGIEGAWLRSESQDRRPTTMNANLEGSQKTIFRFPFPGYGLSGDDFKWTGATLNTDSRFFYLEQKYKDAVLNNYWSQAISLSAITPILINNTTLIDNAAYPNKDYNLSDKLTVWLSGYSYNTTVHSGDTEEAWLYRFNNTDISIKQTGDSVVFWPYEQVNTENDFPEYYPNNLTNVCSPVLLSSINLPFATAGDSLSSSDAIYKINNYKNTKENAIECCWLSGNTRSYSNSNILIINQPSFQGLFKAGSYTNFVWTGIDNTDINTVIKSINHQPDCKFVTTPNTTYKDSNLCTCHQVYFTPFGHSGSNYTDNGSFADFIIEDNFSPKTLNLQDWTDSYGAAYAQSSSFCWFKTNSKQGWGDGKWISGALSAGNSFYLKTGKPYIYYRANTRTQDIETTSLPDLVLRYDFNTYQSRYGQDFIWKKARKTPEGEWQDTTETSNFTIYPGDLLLFDRKPTQYYNLTSVYSAPYETAENRWSIWTSYDYITINNELYPVTVGYPYQTFTTVNILTANQPFNQYPVPNINNIYYIHTWSLTAPDKSIQSFRNLPTFSFTPVLTGLYTLAVTAVTAIPTLASTTSGFYIFSRIPQITAVSNITLIPQSTSYEIPMPGYVLNTPLKGWDYSKNIINPYALSQNAGARPYWAKAYNNKDQYTGYRGIASWGTPQRLVDEHNILTQPEFSNITLNIGDRVEYTRNYPVTLYWTQPIELITFFDRKNWCTLNFTTTSTSNLQYILNNYKNELVVTPTSAISQINLRNIVDNEPVEIYYNAINPFTWSITATPEIQNTFYNTPSTFTAIKAGAPWANLSNQYYPTVAAFPTIEGLSSVKDIGGFFTPSNLGTTVYVDQDFTVSAEATSSAFKTYFQDITKTVGGRGFTKQDQSTPYSITTENNIWIKEPTVAGAIAGTIKKTVFKKYQKFLPYQSGYESNPRLRIGILNPTSRQTPWTGKEDSEWGDVANYPVSPTGELNINNWVQAQVLKQNGLQVDNWLTDVFGNQYGLFKNLRQVPTREHKTVSGEIWVRKNSQYVSPAYEALANIFDTYANTNLINELTGSSGIYKADIFFDTLLVQTSGTVIFEKINYDFDTDHIFSLTDEARYISLAMPVTANLDKEFKNTDLSTYSFAKAGETWFSPEEKIVTITVCGIQDNILTPEIYQLNLNSIILTKIFPLDQEDITTINSLSSLQIMSIAEPLISYNNLKKEFIYAIACKDVSSNDIVIELTINGGPSFELKNTTVYKPTNIILTEPPVVNQNLVITLPISQELNFQVIASNTPATFTRTSETPSWINISSTGLFTGTPPLTGIYNAPFIVNNTAGSTYYALNITVS